MSAITIAGSLIVGVGKDVAGQETPADRPGASERAKATSSLDWSRFRGNRRLTGVAQGKLADPLEVCWTFQAGEPVAATAAIVDDSVYVADDGGTLYALRLTDGKETWRYTSGEPVRSSPTIAGGVVYYGDSAGVFYAVDARTGALRWRYETEGEIISSANDAGDRVVFGSYDGRLYCLSKDDGRLLWSFQTEGRVHASPAIVDENVLIAGCDEFFHVIDLASGRSRSRVAMGSVSGSSPAVVGEMAYVGTYGHKVLGINWRSGAIAWTFEDPERKFPYLASAAVAKGLVVITGRDRRVRALDARTGVERWRFPTQGRNDASPVILDDRVYQPSSDGNLYVLDLKTGARLGRFEAGAPMSASPAIARGRLVIGTEDGTVYCLGKRAAEPP